MLPQGYEADAEEHDGRFLFDVDSIPLTVAKKDVMEITATGVEQSKRRGPTEVIKEAFSRLRK